MEAKDFLLTKFLAAEAQFCVPIYQRKYSWEKENCVKLLDDILKVAQDRTRPCHFIGSVIYMARESAQHAAALQEYFVIDGQQRLTTISIILLALGDYTREYFKDDKEYEKSATSLEKLSKRYIINEDELEQSDTYYKIQLNEEDFYAWKKLLTGREKPDDIKRSRIFENYNVLIQELRKRHPNPQEVFDGIKKLRLIDTCLVPEDNAQLVFETVNSTGLPLSTADKIRNFLLMTAEPDIQARLYREYWHPMEKDLGMESGSSKMFEDFFRYYMLAMLRKQIGYDYYEPFKDYYFEHKSLGTEAMVKQIRQYSKYYIRWIKAKADGGQIDSLLCRIRQIGQWKFTPIILQLLSDQTDRLISEDDAVQILGILESYLMRRSICNLPPNSAGPASLSMLKSLIPPTDPARVDKFNRLKSFKKNILNLTWAQRIPTDKEMLQILQTLPLYTINKSRTKQLLDRLENYGTKEHVPTGGYTIEHIMPQTLSSEWENDLGADCQQIHQTYLHTIGNLTLTCYNSEYQNKRFVDKRDCRDKDGNLIGYLHTPIRISESVAKASQWGREEIIARTASLTEIIIKIWPYPQ